MILAADNNGGRYNKVYRQTDDGFVISVAMGESLLPLVFRYEDYLGCIEESLLSWYPYAHKRLMRGDCGWRVENDSVDLLFSWNGTEKHIDGFSSGPSGEFSETYHDEQKCAKDVRICGLKGHRTKWYRKDREYWTPGQTLAAQAPADPFALTMNTEYNDCCENPEGHEIPTIKQWNPISCPPEAPDKCGLNNYYDDCDKARKIKPNHCRLEGGEDAFGNPITTDL